MCHQGPPGSEGLPGPPGPAVSEEGGRGLWTESPDPALESGDGTVAGEGCIVLCGDRVPEESEDPKEARVRKETR